MTTPARKINGDELVVKLETEPRPMQADDLAHWQRFFLESPNVPYRTFALAVVASHEHYTKLAADLEARVRQLEERCALDAEDIREHRVTRAQVEKWAGEHGWECDNTSDHRSYWVRDGKRSVRVTDGHNAIAYNIDEFAVADNRNAWDVLREMAAIQVPGTIN